MKNEMKCLIGVPTFRRPQFLPRIIACFERLNYDNKKMVIINDDIDTKYYYNGNLNIEIVNIDKHLSLAVKRNMFACWDFDILFPLDDDDLFFPNRLKNHVTQYRQNPLLDLYRNRSCIFTNGTLMKIGDNSSFTNSSFTRAGYFKSGGYTNFSRSNHDDIMLRSNFLDHCKVKIENNPREIDFLYQFDGGRYHNTNIQDKLMSSDMMMRTLKQRSVVGDVELNPDYEVYDNLCQLRDIVVRNLNIDVKTVENGVNFLLKD